MSSWLACTTEEDPVCLTPYKGGRGLILSLEMTLFPLIGRSYVCVCVCVCVSRTQTPSLLDLRMQAAVPGPPLLPSDKVGSPSPGSYFGLPGPVSRLNFWKLKAVFLTLSVSFPR